MLFFFIYILISKIGKFLRVNNSSHQSVIEGVKNKLPH
jgi:hypothetical protein